MRLVCVFHIVAWPFLGRIEGMLHFSHGLQVLVRSTIFIAPYTSFSHGVPDRRGLRRPNIDHRPQTSTTNRIKPACAVAVGQRMGQTKRRRDIIATLLANMYTRLKTHPDLPHLINVYTRFPHTRFTIYRGAILDMRFQDSPGRSWGLRKNLSGTSHIL